VWLVLDCSITEPPLPSDATFSHLQRAQNTKNGQEENMQDEVQQMVVEVQIVHEHLQPTLRQWVTECESLTKGQSAKRYASEFDIFYFVRTHAPRTPLQSAIWYLAPVIEIYSYRRRKRQKELFTIHARSLVPTPR
jgi:hypothetical protein